MSLLRDLKFGAALNLVVPCHISKLKLLLPLMQSGRARAQPGWSLVVGTRIILEQDYLLCYLGAVNIAGPRDTKWGLQPASVYSLSFKANDK